MSIGATFESPSKEHSGEMTHDPQDDKRPSPNMDWAFQSDSSPKL
jgi:hypothetical protein